MGSSALTDATAAIDSGVEGSRVQRFQLCQGEREGTGVK